MMDVLSSEEGGNLGEIPEQHFEGHGDENGAEVAGQHQQSHVEFYFRSQVPLKRNMYILDFRLWNLETLLNASFT